MCNVYPPPEGEVPFLSAGQMAEVDRVAMESLGISLAQMMENAGRNLAALARGRFLEGDPRGRRVVVLVGPGGNGGGALVCARHLHAWGARVRVYATRPDEEFTLVAGHQLAVVRRMGIPAGRPSDLARARAADLVVDGILGYSMRGAPRAEAEELIRWTYRQTAPILSLDVPSGMDATTGRIHEPGVRASATLTLALPKRGLRAPGARDYTGELYLGDVGIPPAVYAHPGLGWEVPPLFARHEILRLR